MFGQLVLRCAVIILTFRAVSTQTLYQCNSTENGLSLLTSEIVYRVSVFCDSANPLEDSPCDNYIQKYKNYPSGSYLIWEDRRTCSVVVKKQPDTQLRDLEEVDADNQDLDAYYDETSSLGAPKYEKFHYIDNVDNYEPLGDSSSTEKNQPEIQTTRDLIESQQEKNDSSSEQPKIKDDQTDNASDDEQQVLEIRFFVESQTKENESQVFKNPMILILGLLIVLVLLALQFIDSFLFEYIFHRNMSELKEQSEPIAQPEIHLILVV